MISSARAQGQRPSVHLKLLFALPRRHHLDENESVVLQKLLVVIRNQTFIQPSAALAALACGKEYLIISRVIILTALYIHLYLVTTASFICYQTGAINLAGMHCRGLCEYSSFTLKLDIVGFRWGMGNRNFALVFSLEFAWICLGSNGSLVS